MTLNDYVPLIFRRLRPQSRPNEATSLITQLAQKYGLENIGEIDEQFLNGFICASEIVIAQLEKEFESDNKTKSSVHVDDMGRYDPYTDSFVRGKAE